MSAFCCNKAEGIKTSISVTRRLVNIHVPTFFFVCSCFVRYWVQTATQLCVLNMSVMSLCSQNYIEFQSYKYLWERKFHLHRCTLLNTLLVMRPFLASTMLAPPDLLHSSEFCFCIRCSSAVPLYTVFFKEMVVLRHCYITHWKSWVWLSNSVCWSFIRGQENPLTLGHHGITILDQNKNSKIVVFHRVVYNIMTALSVKHLAGLVSTLVRWFKKKHDVESELNSSY